MRWLYTLLLYLIMPLVLLHLLWRGLGDRAYLKRWPERFGFFDPPEHTGGIVVHAASVGEVNVARRMQKEGAVVGGEGNGGVILPALHHTRDAPLASALI